MVSENPQTHDLAAIRKLLNAAFDDVGLVALCQDEFPELCDQLGRGLRKAEIVNLIVDYVRRTGDDTSLLAAIQARAPDLYARFEAAAPLSAAVQSEPGRSLRRPTRVFVCYKRGGEPDDKLAHFLAEFLTSQGCEVFIDTDLVAGKRWLPEIDRQLKASDYLLVLLSKESADSEMVQAEVHRAYEHRKRQGHPRILPVRVAYEGLLPYSVDVFLDKLQYVIWQRDGDEERVGREVLAAIEGRMKDREPVRMEVASGPVLLSEDGRPLPDGEALSQPLPEFDPRFLLDMRVPRGIVRLQSKFYVEREADAILMEEIVQPGSLTYIRAPRQMGKSSLLVRGIQHARENGISVAFVDCQFTDSEHLGSLDGYLRCLAEMIGEELGVGGVDEMWQSPHVPKTKMNRFLKSCVLDPADAPVLLALDELDHVYGMPFQSDFFGMIRGWQGNAQWREGWKKLILAMVISTEPHLLIDDPYQSPFNVGLGIVLKEFGEGQVADLNYRHGNLLEPDQVRDMTRFLGGHPYLTRKAFFVMVRERLSWDDLIERATDQPGPFSDHLRRYLWLLHEKPELARAMKKVISNHTCPDEVILQRLQAAGLIRRVGTECTCRCELYREFLRNNL